MNINEKLTEVKRGLNLSGFHSLVKEIEDAQMVLGTKGEMFSPVIDKLNQLKKNNSLAYSVIKTEIDELITYAKSIGY
jgi:hypothetical protein